MGNQTRLLFATMRSPRFVRFLEKMSGIDGLVPDPAYEGSGIHITTRGGHLQVHSDFNHLGADLKWHRRLNIFVCGARTKFRDTKRRHGRSTRCLT